MMKNLLLLIVGICLFSCQKESFITGSEARINLSEDSIYFDTLFTSTGSVTQYFKIFNDNDQKLKISRISVNGGAGSYFKINADGVSGPEVTNLEMEANDSLYVFVTVKIDPSDDDLPYIIEDSVNIDFNGNSRQVKLSAWGQNATFLNSVMIDQDVLFTNERPFVILGGMLVAEGATLHIEKGTKIYLHADAPLYVDGTINAIGETFDSTKIIFRGDRLDDGYKDYPGAWPGIYFSEKSVNNILTHVIVKNAYQGIVADGTDGLQLNEVIIDNCYDAGIIGSKSKIEAVNCLVSNCGKNILLVGGGDYSFTHCTDVAISNNFIQHKQPVLTIADFIKNGDDVIVGEVHARFTNCIFWGSGGVIEDEVRLLREGSDVFDVNFTNSIWKLSSEPEEVTSTGMILNQDPLFMQIDPQDKIYDFHLSEGSPAIRTGIDAGVLKDLEETSRKTPNPDIGAYESTF